MKVKGPQSLAFRLWLVRWNRLSTRNYLQQCGILINELYTVCVTDQETILHVVRDCLWIKSIWQQLVPRTWWARFFQDILVFDWVDFNLGTSLDRSVDCQMIFRMAIQIAWQILNEESHDPTFCIADPLVMHRYYGTS